MKTIQLGTAPKNEETITLGIPMYRLHVIRECTKYIKLLRESFGKEPNKSKFGMQNFSCDMGVCTEATYTYDENNVDECEYARKCKEDTPENWI